MISVSRIDDKVIFEVEGWDKLWAFRGRLEIPLEHIHDAYTHHPSTDEILGGLRLLGTGMPGVIKAGTFYQQGKWVFWDVHNRDNVVIIDLVHDHYDKLVIEVADPAGVVGLISSWKLASYTNSPNPHTS